MRKKPIVDMNGTPLTPSWQGKRCLGNGENTEYECCCDECNCYLYCFPQYKWELEIKILKMRIKNFLKKG